MAGLQKPRCRRLNTRSAPQARAWLDLQLARQPGLDPNFLQLLNMRYIENRTTENANWATGELVERSIASRPSTWYTMRSGETSFVTTAITTKTCAHSAGRPGECAVDGHGSAAGTAAAPRACAAALAPGRASPAPRSLRSVPRSSKCTRRGGGVFEVYQGRVLYKNFYLIQFLSS